MTGIFIRIDDEAVTGQLQRLEDAAGDMQPAMAAIGAAMLQSTQRRFERETGPDGKKWAPLRPRTAAARIGRGRRGTANILRVSTRLYQSLTFEASNTEARVGSNVVYAAIHQLGGAIDMPERQQTIHLSTGKRKRFVRSAAKRKESRAVTIGAHQVRMPARPYLGIDQADRDTITSIVADHFAEAAR
ncbi:phage virion morphogenesis protein [Tianweitania sediminis]|uniref:Phage virion morphogenesis protein n=1 Tax=Tianweitania sediminis TaxID=1502156 RepID=A0A8J7R7C0_9HYPH|nr:phage virion morphogenesis protein [Tianweitania sediminis]